MMDKWRTKGGDKCNNQEYGRSKSNYYSRKPPIAGGTSNMQQNIPLWEKRFVTSSMSWKQFLEAKRYTYLCDNVLNWDDSAGEEAFKASKDRFYASFHGLPSDEAELNNPDLYIDKINWNGQVDHKLIMDLESEPVVPNVDSNHEPVIIFGDALPDPYKTFSSNGWGDADDKNKKSWGVGDDDVNKGDGGGVNWDDYIKDGKILWDNSNVWWDWNNNSKNNIAGDQDWSYNDKNAGDQGWNENGYKVGDNRWDDTLYGNDNNNYNPSYGNVNNERYVSNKAGDQGWNYNINKTGGQGWNDNDNKAGYNGWNGNMYENNYHSYGNAIDSYYSSYGNVNNERYNLSNKACKFYGNNSQINHSWRNNGSGRKSNGQGYGSQRPRRSTMQAHGGQRIHVHP